MKKLFESSKSDLAKISYALRKRYFEECDKAEATNLEIGDLERRISGEPTLKQESIKGYNNKDSNKSSDEIFAEKTSHINQIYVENRELRNEIKSLKRNIEKLWGEIRHREKYISETSKRLRDSRHLSQQDKTYINKIIREKNDVVRRLGEENSKLFALRKKIKDAESDRKQISVNENFHITDHYLVTGNLGVHGPGSFKVDIGDGIEVYTDISICKDSNIRTYGIALAEKQRTGVISRDIGWYWKIKPSDQLKYTQVPFSQVQPLPEDVPTITTTTSNTNTKKKKKKGKIRWLLYIDDGDVNRYIDSIHKTKEDALEYASYTYPEYLHKIKKIKVYK